MRRFRPGRHIGGVTRRKASHWPVSQRKSTTRFPRTDRTAAMDHRPGSRDARAEFRPDGSGLAETNAWDENRWPEFDAWPDTVETRARVQCHASGTVRFLQRP